MREYREVCKSVKVVVVVQRGESGVLSRKCQAGSRNPSSGTWARLTPEPHINMPVDKPTLVSTVSLSDATLGYVYKPNFALTDPVFILKCLGRCCQICCFFHQPVLLRQILCLPESFSEGNVVLNVSLPTFLCYDGPHLHPNVFL